MGVAIRGLGTALPAHGITQERAASLFAELTGCSADDRRRVRTLFRLAGVKQRRSVVLASDSGQADAQSFFGNGHGNPTTSVRMERYAAEASSLAVTAARGALAEAALPASAVTHLVVVSCTGFGAPGVDHALITELGLSPDTLRTQIGFMGCHGAINGLRVAQAYAAAAEGCVLLVCVELCSLHLQYELGEGQAVANALFGDGAAAVVVSAGAGPWRLRQTASRVFTNSAEAMTWSIGDHGFEMTLSAGVPALIEAELRPWLAGWLAGLGLTIEAIGAWALHPGGPRVIDAVSTALALPPSATAVSRAVLAELGNMSSPTVLFVLDLLRQSGAAGPWLLLAFGPGLTAEAALLE